LNQIKREMEIPADSAKNGKTPGPRPETPAIDHDVPGRGAGGDRISRQGLVVGNPLSTAAARAGIPMRGVHPSDRRPEFGACNLAANRINNPSGFHGQARGFRPI